MNQLSNKEADNELIKLKEVLEETFWFTSRELQAAAEFYDLHIIEYSYQYKDKKKEYSSKIKKSNYKFYDNKLHLLVCRESSPFKMVPNVPIYYQY